MSLFDRLQRQADTNRAASLDLTADTATGTAPLVVSSGMGGDGPLATDLIGAGVPTAVTTTGNSGIVRPLEILVRGQGDNVWADVGNASKGYRFEPLKQSAVCPGGVSGCSDSGWSDELDLPKFEIPDFLLPDFTIPPGGFQIDWPPPPPDQPDLPRNCDLTKYGAELGCCTFCYDPQEGSHCGPCNRPKGCDAFNVFGSSCGVCMECQDTIIGSRCVDKANPPHCSCANHPGCGNGTCQPDGSCKRRPPPPPIPPEPAEPCICAPVCWNTGCGIHCVYMNSCSGWQSHAGCEGYGSYTPYGSFNGANMYPTSCSKCASCVFNPATLTSTCVNRCEGDCVRCNEATGRCILDPDKCQCRNNGDCAKGYSCVAGACAYTGPYIPPWGCGPCMSAIDGPCLPVPGCECTKSSDCGPCSQCINGKCKKTGCKGGCSCTITTLTYKYLYTGSRDEFVCTHIHPNYGCTSGYYRCTSTSELGTLQSVTGCNVKLPAGWSWLCVTNHAACPQSARCYATPVLVSSTSVQADGCGTSCAPCFNR